jgi:hypothetical protein
MWCFITAVQGCPFGITHGQPQQDAGEMILVFWHSAPIVNLAQSLIFRHHPDPPSRIAPFFSRPVKPINFVIIEIVSFQAAEQTGILLTEPTKPLLADVEVPFH